MLPKVATQVALELAGHYHRPGISGQPEKIPRRGANLRERELLDRAPWRHAKLMEAIENATLPALLKEWERDQAAFSEQRMPYLIYH